MQKILFLFVSLILVTSCLPTVALAPEYWNKPSKVGIFVNANPPSKYKAGSQGLLDMAVTSGDKYEAALHLIGNEIKPKDELIAMYSEILKSKGKEIVIIDENFNAKTAKKFSGKKAEGKKYPQYDFSDLKAKYNIDEILFVDVSYGFVIHYSGFIEIGKMAHTLLNTNFIDLSDQSLIMANINVKGEEIKKWKENNYRNSLETVRKTLDQAKEEEEEKNIHFK